MTDIIDMTAGQIAAGPLPPSAVMAAFLARVGAVNGAVNAICTINPAAMDEARAADARLASGGPRRLLEGVPLLVKDNIETKGLRTTFGSNLYAENVQDFDAIAVERLRAAGAIVIGKTNTPAFAADISTTNDLFGYTRNPWDLGVTPGGSSGGTGAALAAGMAPIGLGTDLGGSVRVPAAHNGIVGLRPSQGRVPAYSAEFAWDTLVAHVHGPMARCVADIGLMLQALAGADDRDPASVPAAGEDYVAAAAGSAAIAGKRFAVSYDMNGILPLEPEVRALVAAAVDRLAGLGAVMEEAFFDVSDLMSIMSGTRAFNMVARHADRYEAHADRMPRALVNQVEGAMKVDLRTVTRAERGRTAYYHRARELLARYDYILTPAVGAPPFRLDEPLPTTVAGKPVERYYDTILSCYAFSITGLPAIVVPCGFSTKGLPVGLQIVGSRLRDDAVLAAAAAYASVSGDCFRRPEIDFSTLTPVLTSFATPGMKIG
jgi:amidase